MEVTLKEYIESRMDEREKAHRSQLDNAERNLKLAAEALREWKIEHNNFRQQIDSERALYVRMDQLKGYHDRIEELEQWRAEIFGRQVVFGIAVVVGAGALAGVVVAVLRLVGH